MHGLTKLLTVVATIGTLPAACSQGRQGESDAETSNPELAEYEAFWNSLPSGERDFQCRIFENESVSFPGAEQLYEGLLEDGVAFQDLSFAEWSSFLDREC